MSPQPRRKQNLLSFFFNAPTLNELHCRHENDYNPVYILLHLTSRVTVPQLPLCDFILFIFLSDITARKRQLAPAVWYTMTECGLAVQYFEVIGCGVKSLHMNNGEVLFSSVMTKTVELELM